MSELHAHLESGTTTVCHCWLLTRRDGAALGFTDHDLDLAFEGQTFRADSGMGAKALSQSTGLSVDNTEAMGALSSDAITEADIAAGRFDGASVTAWRVNWADISQREVVFRGEIGDLKRAGGAFSADLRSLASQLNRPLGRIYQKPCTAVLGDADCGFDISNTGYSVECTLIGASDGTLRFAALPGFEDAWFSRGALTVLSGTAQGLAGSIKRDKARLDTREITLWTELRAPLQPGDQVRLVAGCDKRFETCRLKFLNHLNFRGFPDLPGDDWSLRLPSGEEALDGGSRR